MNTFVLDHSLILPWCFEDQATEESDWLLSLLTHEEQPYKALIPSLWHLQLSDILHNVEKQELLTTSESLQFMGLLESLPLETDITRYTSKDILTLSRSYDLTAYEAIYFLLALRSSVPLATLDPQLKKMAQKARIPLVSHKKYKPFGKK